MRGGLEQLLPKDLLGRLTLRRLGASVFAIAGLIAAAPGGLLPGIFGLDSQRSYAVVNRNQLCEPVLASPVLAVLAASTLAVSAVLLRLDPVLALPLLAHQTAERVFKQVFATSTQAAYPSGHAATWGAIVVVMLAVVARRAPRFRAAAALVVGILLLHGGACVVRAGGHTIRDVLGAYLLVAALTCLLAPAAPAAHAAR
ncbi:MAG: hypothetical protein JWM64_2667 [Frankiales bacterium]|nr:hypothetical protein [Frankiales bacterium]